MGLFDAFKKKNSSTIVISTAPEPGPTEAKINAIEEEEGICNDIIRRIKEDRPQQKHDWEIRHRSQDYTTLAYRNSDLLRVKWTENSHWIRIQMDGENATKHENDPIFSHQEKKTELMWRVPCNTKEDIDTLYPYILEAWDSIENFTVRIPLTDTEREYVKAAADLLAEVTGDAEHTYISKSTKDIDIMYYASSNCCIRLTPYKRKPWKINIDDGVELSGPEDIKNYKAEVEKRYEHFNSWRDGYIKYGMDYMSYCMHWTDEK